MNQSLLIKRLGVTELLSQSRSRVIPVIWRVLLVGCHGTGVGGWFSQRNRPTRRTTNYEGDGGLRFDEMFILIQGVGICLSA